VRELAGDVGQIIRFKRPTSSTYVGDMLYQLDSPISLLKFKMLPFIDRVRAGVIVAFLKLDPLWKPLEKITSYEFLTKYMGEGSWKILWEPLFIKKFGAYARKINAAWFWARVKKRSASLGYPEGGFMSFAEKIVEKIRNRRSKNINTQLHQLK
jgi:protoporphyrinogen oxidase